MKILLLFLITATTFFLSKQTLAAGGPDAYGYTYKTSLDAGGPTYNWVDIITKPGVQNVTGLADDNSAPSMFNIGFNFHFYLNDYSQLKIGSNGWVSFSAISNFASCFSSIPTAGGTGDNLLGPFVSDLNFTGTGNPGQVKFWTNNSDSCIISYINVPYWSVSSPGWAGSNTFQIILSAADSSITFQYGTIDAVPQNSNCTDMSVGIENNTGEIGLQAYSDISPPSNYAIKFQYPDVVLMTFRDPVTLWNNNSANRAVFIPQNYPHSLVSDFANVGNQNVTTTINLEVNILNSVSSIVHSSTGTLNGLTANNDTVFNFPNIWTPSATGQYTHSTTLSNSQESNTGNNTKLTELGVVDICGSSMMLSYATSGGPNATINWNGGANDDGAAVYFEPPVYPYTISELQFYINSSGVHGYVAEVYDNDGPNGSKGTLLFTQTVPNASVTSSAWNTISLSSPITLSDGGFYVAWFQGGSTIHLGVETTGPFSLRNFEILDGAWAQYRLDPTREIMIRAIIDGFSDIPVAGFTETTDQLDVDFSDNSGGIYKSWMWDFGDGNFSMLQNPTHSYIAPGEYSVCLTTTTPCGFDTECRDIVVDDLALPIELIEFNAYSLNRTVLTEWKTASEINNDYFTIERSGNGIEWELVGNVNAAGNSSQLLNYRLVDEAPIVGLSYYRLKQTDFDGHFTYSDIKSVKINNENEFEVYPNPSNGNFIIRSNEYETFSLFNELGQKIVTAELSSSNNHEISISNLETGVYFLFGNYQYEAQKIVVTK